MRAPSALQSTSCTGRAYCDSALRSWPLRLQSLTAPSSLAANRRLQSGRTAATFAVAAHSSQSLSHRRSSERRAWRSRARRMRVPLCRSRSQSRLGLQQAAFCSAVVARRSPHRPNSRQEKASSACRRPTVSRSVSGASSDKKS